MSLTVLVALSGQGPDGYWPVARKLGLDDVRYLADPLRGDEGKFQGELNPIAERRVAKRVANVLNSYTF